MAVRSNYSPTLLSGNFRPGFDRPLRIIAPWDNRRSRIPHRGIILLYFSNSRGYKLHRVKLYVVVLSSPVIMKLKLLRTVSKKTLPRHLRRHWNIHYPKQWMKAKIAAVRPFHQVPTDSASPLIQQVLRDASLLTLTLVTPGHEVLSVFSTTPVHLCRTTPYIRAKSLNMVEIMFPIHHFHS